MRDLAILLASLAVWIGLWAAIVQRRGSLSKWVAHMLGAVCGLVMGVMLLLALIPNEEGAAPRESATAPAARDALAISPNDIEGEWPLTVESGRFVCGERAALLLDGEGQRYALNGQARGRIKNNESWRDIDAIWKPDPDTGGKINIGPLLDAGIAACKSAGEWDDGMQLVNPPEDRSGMAAVQCVEFVKSALIAPATAKFPWSSASGGAWQKPDQVYLIKSHVDAQNVYGALLRHNYSCEVQHFMRDGKDMWRLLDLTVE